MSLTTSSTLTCTTDTAQHTDTIQSSSTSSIACIGTVGRQCTGSNISLIVSVIIPVLILLLSIGLLTAGIVFLYHQKKTIIAKERNEQFNKSSYRTPITRAYNDDNGSIKIKFHGKKYMLLYFLYNHN